MIRELNLNDLVKLENSAKFPLNDIDSKMFCIKKAIEEDGELIGSVMVHITSEVSIILNEKVSRIKKARAILEIFSFLGKELVKLGFEDAHVFIKDNPTYAAILKKHYGFEDVVGTALVVRKGC
jgi:alanine dehydrogenase